MKNWNLRHWSLNEFGFIGSPQFGAEAGAGAGASAGARVGASAGNGAGALEFLRSNPQVLHYFHSFIHKVVQMLDLEKFMHLSTGGFSK